MTKKQKPIKLEEFDVEAVLSAIASWMIDAKGLKDPETKEHRKRLRALEKKLKSWPFVK
jgi:hypothetical protein